MRRREGAAPRRPGTVALLLPFLALLFGSCSGFFQESAPRRDGELAVRGVSAPVSVIRDRYGIPHITAANDHDLYFAEGFVHAQDRLFQMDVERRLARGELSEMFGEKALPADRLFRHLGFASRAPATFASLPGKSREIVEAYCEGVNAAMDSLGAWPVEMRLLRVPPRPFLPEDVVAVGLLKALGLAQWVEEATFHRIALRIPPAKLAELLPRPEAGPSPAVPAAGPPAAMSASPALLVEGLASLRETVGAPERYGGSNAWAVSGKKSATGRPILASDPHLLLPCPSLWYEAHLVAPGVDVYGVSFPGAPGVVIGHNTHIAWGFTNAMLDDSDYFVERLDGDRVLSRNRWVPLDRRVETIRVRGGKDETVTVVSTPHGPILSPVLPGIATALSFRWTGYDGGDSVGALYALNRARNRVEFEAALSAFTAPAQNVVYADDAGNIGVVLAGRIPKRKGGVTLLPVPGDSGEWDWNGYVPFAENPRTWNPPGQIVVAANFPPTDASNRHYLSRIYEPSDRGRRIFGLLREEEKLTVEAFERIQNDILLPDAGNLVSLAVMVAKKRSTESPAFPQAAKILSAWDRSVGSDSQGALLYEVFYEKLIEEIYRDDLGEDLYEEFTRTSRLAWNAVDRVIERGDSLFFENASRGRKDTLEDVVARSLVAAVAHLTDRLGGSRSTWAWGRLHQVAFEHPFGKKRYLQRWFNIGPFQAPGDGRTVRKADFRHGTDFSVLIGPSMRQIVPLGDRPLSRSVITTGQSGHFFESHYRDQAPLWLAGKTHPAWTDRKGLDLNTESRLTLVPVRPAPGR